MKTIESFLNFIQFKTSYYEIVFSESIRKLFLVLSIFIPIIVSQLFYFSGEIDFFLYPIFHSIIIIFAWIKLDNKNKTEHILLQRHFINLIGFLIILYFITNLCFHSIECNISRYF